MSTKKENTKRLQELGGSDYEIADGQPDIRGWDVKDAAGKRIGEVDELLFDESARKVRYLVLDLEDNALDLEPRDVLVPIGLAELHKNDDDVILSNVTADQLRALPEYDEDNFGTGLEEKVRNVFGGAALTGASMASNEGDSKFYDHDHFNEDNLYRNRRAADTDNASIPVIKEELQVGKREVETGGIRLRSRTVENEVQENINLREEKVTVERTATDRLATEADLQSTDIEMSEKAEVPVVHKEARVVEEVSLNKDVTEREETIRGTVRNTEVDIDKKDNDETRRTDTNKW